MTNRSLLPQNFITNPSTLFEDFENVADWAIYNGTGTIAADTVNFKTGTQSIKLTPSAAGVALGINKTINSNFANSSKFLTFDIFIADPSSFSQLWVYLCTTSGMGRCMQVNWQPPSSTNGVQKGLNRVVIDISDWTSLGGGVWSDTETKLGIRFQSNATINGSISFDNLSFGQRSTPKVIFSFDNTLKDSYDNLFNGWMVPNGVKGTLYITSNNVDNTSSGLIYMSTAECTNLYNKGWALGNQTQYHTDLTTCNTLADVKAVIQPCADWLTARGFTRAMNHTALSFGAYIKSGDNGDFVLGSLQSLGFKTVRTSYPGKKPGLNYAPFNVTSSFAGTFMYAATMNDTTTVAMLKGYIDDAVKYGAVLHIYGHEFTAAGGTGTIWRTADAIAVMQYAIAKFGLSNIITIDEFWNGITNPRYRSI